jgi:hypothetical protein
VAVGDVDADGHKDPAITGQCSQVVVLRNNGKGSFASGGAFGSGTAPRAVSLADFNNDGFPDIAYLNAAPNGSVTVLFNNRNGTFGSPLSLYAGDLPYDFAAGDFDGDGSQDVVIANPYFSQVIVLFNDSAGTFQTGYSELNAGDTPDSITLGDLDSDGRLDIAAASRNNNQLAILLNTGNYNFSNPFFYPVSQGAVAVAAGNLDGDVRRDLVAVNQTGSTITVLLSALPPPPPPPPPFTLTGSTRRTASARFVDLRWNGATDARVDVYRNNSRITTVPNTGSYSDRFSRTTRGSFTYRVCNAGTGTCSNTTTLTF